ncbi:MAG: hypothetical protein HZB53_15275 [Chloroflexi bacterium]|nr:hypothetical protein [Chloroflexota bacterium]
MTHKILTLVGLALFVTLMAGSLAAPQSARAAGPLIVVRAFSETGGAPSAADNDYTRINNAIQSVANGDTIKLIGTFDWTEVNAAASWAKGSDGIASNADDYEIVVPAGRNNVVLTADYLGAATIQGPGDLPAVNLEGFLDFEGGPNQNWTISNLRILDFDLSIGMFYGAGGTTAFNGVKIKHNYIRIATDLNSVDAPADINQNIGIHYSFGANQTIAYNTIDIPGNGVSDSGAPADWWTYGLAGGSLFSSNIAMQSNTSGGNVYDGLLIDRNTIRVLNAQSANPSRIIGIWENGHAHSSNITVSNNQFINLAGGNDPALNRQIAFRPTSHSSGSTTVTYSNNTVQGAGLGFGPMDVSGVQPLLMKHNVLTSVFRGFKLGLNENYTFINNRLSGVGGGEGIEMRSASVSTVGTPAGSNFITGFGTGVSVMAGSASILYTQLTGNGTGLAVSGGTASVNYSNISGNSAFGVNNNTATPVNATTNWWGSDTGPGGTNNGVNGPVTTLPFAKALSASTTASTHELGETGTLDSNVTANGLYGAQLVVNHDNSLMTFAAGSSANNVGGWFWDFLAQNFSHPTVNQTALSGTMRRDMLHTVGANLSGQSIATWKYACAAAGTGTLMYDNTAGTGTLLSDINGLSLPSALIGDSVTCVAATADSTSGSIALQGRVQGTATPAGWNGAVVALTCTGGACIGSGPYYFPATDINGAYAIVKAGPGTGVALGTYSASVVRRAYLPATKAAVTIVAGANVVSTAPVPTLLGGDVTSDNLVDIADLTALGGAFGTSVTPDTGADVNGDGFVNVFDLVLAGGNYGSTASVWP